MLRDMVRKLHLHIPQHLTSDLADRGLIYKNGDSLQEFMGNVENCNKVTFLVIGYRPVGVKVYE